MNEERPSHTVKPARKTQPPVTRIEVEQHFGAITPGGEGTGVKIGHVENLIVESTAAPAPGDPPYKGLDFYDVADAPLFFGRERLTADLVEAVRGHTFLAILGASGSGKSSLARAGLIATLLGKADRPLERGVQPPLGSRDWRYVAVTPTAHPFEALARGLAGDSAEGAALLAALAADPLALREHAASGEHLLLLVDQFEELFTLCKDKDQRMNYVNALLAACGEPAFDRGAAPCTVILTVRADFYDRCIGFEKLRSALERRQKPIGAMTHDELRRTITLPAEAGLWAFEGGLVDLILAHVGEQPGKLPLLSYALLETWRRRSGRVMTLAGYQAAGGVEGAISQTAERVFAGLTQHGLGDVARRILLSLVDPGQEDRATRRREQLRALAPGGDESPERQALLALSDRAARLVTVDGESVQISHEALITAWPKLGEWLTTYRDDLRLLDGIRDATTAWAGAAEAERDNLLIHRGGRLEDALRLRDGREYTLADPAPAYLAACVALREREAAEKESRRLRELQQARELAQQRSKAATRLRLLAAILAVLALIAPVLWIWQAILRSQARTPLVKMPATQIMVGSPQVAVHVSEFAIERYEVSNQQYDLCIRAGVCASRAGPQSDEDSNVADHPVVYVNAYQADAYCRWLGRRLPTSLEWERAARGDGHEPWPWGVATPDPSRINMSFTNRDSYQTSPVNSYPTGSTTGDPEGVFNLVGNVKEWTATPFNGDHYGSDPQWKLPLSSWLNDDLMARGGSFMEYATALNWVTASNPLPPGQTDLNLGFRCARSEGARYPTTQR